MKRLQGIQTEQYDLEVIECDCGFHLGLDASYLDQVDDIVIYCPSCDTLIDTAAICPEDEAVDESILSGHWQLDNASMEDDEDE